MRVVGKVVDLVDNAVDKLSLASGQPPFQGGAQQWRRSHHP
jgi:hypothetical protein